MIVKRHRNALNAATNSAQPGTLKHGKQASPGSALRTAASYALKGLTGYLALGAALPGALARPMGPSGRALQAVDTSSPASPDAGEFLQVTAPILGVNLQEEDPNAMTPYPTLGRHNQPEFFSGFNMYLPDAAQCGVPRADYASMLDTAADAGANMIRLWFFQSAVQNGDWSVLDNAVSDAKARNLTIVAPLGNMWGNCENITQRKNITFFAGGYKSPLPGDSLSFRDWAGAVAQRYGNEPTIGIWQVMNEPDGRAADGTCDENAAAATLTAFGNDILSALRASGARQLVALGVQGGANCGLSGSHWAAAQSAFDLCTNNAYSATIALMSKQSTTCAYLQKPTLMVELAERRVEETTATPSTASASDLSDRASSVTYFMTMLGDMGYAGTLLWRLTPENTPDASLLDYDIKPSDPVVTEFPATLATIDADIVQREAGKGPPDFR